MNCRTLLAGTWVATACWCGAAAASARDENERLETQPAAQAIPVLTQRLMDAVPGDASVWRRYLSERAVYVSETGDTSNKEELLAAFKPFPPGLSGSIQVESQNVADFGNVAISAFVAHERQTVFDQQIEVNYRVSQTWLREKGRWRLVLSHTTVLAKDPPALPVEAEKLARYVGTYELAGKRRYHVALRGDTLVGGPENREPARLIALGDNVFAEAGSSLGILHIFVAGPDGTIARMVQRRKFADLDWLRAPADRTDSAPTKP